MVDVTDEFLSKAKSYLGEDGKRIGNFYCSGLQEFAPEPNRYDVIWIQWVIGEETMWCYWVSCIKTGAKKKCLSRAANQVTNMKTDWWPRLCKVGL